MAKVLYCAEEFIPSSPVLARVLLGAVGLGVLLVLTRLAIQFLDLRDDLFDSLVRFLLRVTDFHGSSFTAGNCRTSVRESLPSARRGPRPLPSRRDRRRRSSANPCAPVLLFDGVDDVAVDVGILVVDFGVLVLFVQAVLVFLRQLLPRFVQDALVIQPDQPVGRCEFAAVRDLVLVSRDIRRAFP